MMSRTRFAAFALTATTLAVSACGESTKPLTKTELVARVEFVTKADAICRRANARRDLIKKEELAPYLTGLAVIEKRAGSELGRLVPPSSMTSNWNRITGGLQEFASDLTKLEGHVVRSKHARLPRSLVSAAGNAQMQVLTTAKHDGFKDCSKTYVHSADQ